MRSGGLTVAAKPRFNKNEYFPKECVGTAKVRKEKRLKSRDTDMCVLHASCLVIDSYFEVKMTLPQRALITESCSRKDVESKSGAGGETGSGRPTLC